MRYVTRATFYSDLFSPDHVFKMLLFLPHNSNAKGGIYGSAVSTSFRFNVTSYEKFEQRWFGREIARMSATGTTYSATYQSVPDRTCLAFCLVTSGSFDPIGKVAGACS